MTLPLPLLRQLQEATPAEAWAAIAEHALHVCDTAGEGKPVDAAARLRDEGLRALDAWMGRCRLGSLGGVRRRHATHG
jgi:hypothetical protein